MEDRVKVLGVIIILILVGVAQAFSEIFDVSLHSLLLLGVVVGLYVWFVKTNPNVKPKVVDASYPVMDHDEKRINL